MTQKHPWQANKSNSCGSLYFKLQHTRQMQRFQNWTSFARFRHHHEMYITDSLVMLLVLHTIIFVTCELRLLMILTVFQDWVRWCISNAKSRTLELIALKGPTQLLLSQVSESFAWPVSSLLPVGTIYPNTSKHRVMVCFSSQVPGLWWISDLVLSTEIEGTVLKVG